MEQFVDLLLLFFCYAILGWCIEVTLKYFQFHRFINRGFLTGPWLPIYGAGAALITVIIGLLSGFEASYGMTFTVSFFLCGTVEYMTSYVMEKRFHARWWDYSQKPMNLHGRIWIGNLILFGLGGVLIIHFLNPLLYSQFGRMGLTAREILAGLLSAIFIADYIMSHFILKLVKLGVESSEADNTEEIGREVQILLRDRSYFHRRFADAYPEVIYTTERVKERMERVKAETERIRREAEMRIDSVNRQLAESLEPTAAVKNTIIRRQDELIGMLYDEASASDEMKALKGEIDEKTAQLQKRRIRNAVTGLVTGEGYRQENR